MKISTRQRWFLTLWGCCLIGLQYKRVLKGINQNAVIAAENWQRRGFGELDSPHRKIWVTTHTFENSFSYFIAYCSCFILLCMDVYMQSNAWQRSCVRSPAIKKSPRGIGGEEKKAGRGGGEGEEGEGGGRGGVCFSSGARLQSEVDMEKPGNGKMAQRAATQRLSRAPKPALSFTRLGSARFCSCCCVQLDSVSSVLAAVFSKSRRISPSKLC